MMIYEIISHLEEKGYNFTLTLENDIRFNLRPGYNPETDKVKPLFDELKTNKDEAIEYLSLDEEKAFEKYIEELRDNYKYDPRKDLTEDHELWQAVLKEAEKLDKQLYSNLHGFRCCGCKLQLKNNKLKLIPAEAIKEFWEDSKKWRINRKEYLVPYSKEIKDIFNKVTDKILAKK